MKQIHQKIVSGFLLGAAFSAPAFGASLDVTVLPNTTFFTQVYNGNTPQSDFSAGTNSMTTGGVTATATAGLLPSPNATASASVTGGGSSSAYDIVSYYFEVLAPTPTPAGTSVSVTISASGAVSQSNVSTGNSAQLYFGNNLGTSLIASACTVGGSGSCAASGLANQASFSIASTETVVLGVQNLITMDLYVAANTLGGVGNDNQYGYIDPVISFTDPTNPNGYSLIFSPGVGNDAPSASATPLPATWTMMLIGLAGFGFMSFRRRSEPAALMAV
jgi:hypothetical protein